MKALLISGSLNQPSHTFALTEHISTLLIKHGIDAIHWNLVEKPLPFADPAYHHDQLNYPNNSVIEFVNRAIEADMFVFSSPVYHNSYSGVLKNAIDHLSMSYFTYKPIGLLSHGANRNTQAVDHLRIVSRGILGHAITTQICTANEDYIQENGNYLIHSQIIEQRIDRFLSELLLIAETFRVIRNTSSYK